ncbi:MAG: purine-nucleoside phosphorylase, partial [Bdellovibrionales bacterium]
MSPFQRHYKKIKIQPPVCHFVLGSGYSSLVDEVIESKVFKNWEERDALSFKKAGLATPRILSHQGRFRYFLHKTGSSIVLQCGRLHAYEGHDVSTVVQPVIQSLLSGCKKFVISNLAGSLKKEHQVGSVVALTDHLNRTGRSPLVGLSLLKKQDLKKEDSKDPFPNMNAAYDAALRKSITQEMLAVGLKVQAGTYVGVLGPELETPLEIAWLNKSSEGLFDAVGMSTVLEVIALKYL